jgi:hypothetical protein
VLVFEAMATFVGQVSVLSLIALFGAATTAMVSRRERFASSPLNTTTLAILQLKTMSNTVCIYIFCR